MTPARLASLAILLLAPSALLCAQGSLTPPGPPEPGMKTLTQIEPRRPVSVQTLPSTAGYKIHISQPGSYYLTEDLVSDQPEVGGIHVSASHVTIDLNGFRVVGMPGSTAIGILGDVADSAGLVVMNGRLSGWLTAISGGARDLSVRNVRISDCGIAGIFSNEPGSRIEHVSVERYGSLGIYARGNGSVVKDCTVLGAVFNPDYAESVTGIHSVEVIRCVVSGISVPQAAAVIGIRAKAARDCTVERVDSQSALTMIEADSVIGCVVDNPSVLQAGSGDKIGIRGSLVKDSRVSNFRVHTSGLVTGIRASRVVDCTMENVSNGGGTLANGITDGTVSISQSSGTSTALHVSGTSVSGVQGRAISSASHTTVENCRISWCGTGIWTQTSALLRNNHFTNITPGAAIEAVHGEVSGNVVYHVGNTTGAGIVVSGIARVTGNTVIGGDNGYLLSGSVRAAPIVTGGGSGSFDANANLRFN